MSNPRQKWAKSKQKSGSVRAWVGNVEAPILACAQVRMPHAWVVIRNLKYLNVHTNHTLSLAHISIITLFLNPFSTRFGPLTTYGSLKPYNVNRYKLLCDLMVDNDGFLSCKVSFLDTWTQSNNLGTI